MSTINNLDVIPGSGTVTYQSTQTTQNTVLSQAQIKSVIKAITITNLSDTFGLYSSRDTNDAFCFKSLKPGVGIKLVDTGTDIEIIASSTDTITGTMDLFANSVTTRQGINFYNTIDSVNNIDASIVVTGGQYTTDNDYVGNMIITANTLTVPEITDLNNNTNQAATTSWVQELVKENSPDNGIDFKGFVGLTVSTGIIATGSTISDSTLLTTQINDVTTSSRVMGEILTYVSTLDTSGSLTDVAGTNVEGYGGSGVNATFNIESNALYIASDVAIGNAGYNYKQNEVISIQNVGNLTITNVDVSGAIISFNFTPSDIKVGSDIAGTVSQTSTTGNGYGATFVVSSEKIYVPTKVSLNYSGEGYSVGDSITLQGVGSIVVQTVQTANGVKLPKVASGTIIRIINRAGNSINVYPYDGTEQIEQISAGGPQFLINNSTGEFTKITDTLWRIG